MILVAEIHNKISPKSCRDLGHISPKSRRDRRRDLGAVFGEFYCRRYLALISPRSSPRSRRGSRRVFGRRDLASRRHLALISPRSTPRSRRDLDAEISPKSCRDLGGQKLAEIRAEISARISARSRQNFHKGNVRIELQIEMENDKNLIWRGDGQADAAGTTYRLIVTRLQLYVPRIIFNAEGQKLYLENYLKPHRWTYLPETTYNQDMRTQRTGNFRLTNGILKPRHVFIFFINNANLDDQRYNPFLYNTFSVSTDPRTLDQCYLEVGNGN